MSDENEIINEEQNELYEHYSFTVDKGQSPIRIDRYVTDKIEGASRNRIQNAADAGWILVNGIAKKCNYKVKPLDKISIVMPYERRGVEIIPENIPLDILYEDDDLLVINKPAGMVVHPGHGNYSGTLVNALAYHLRGNENVNLEDERAGLLVHRIDKDTSGTIVVAKNLETLKHLAQQFFNHTVQRLYHALVWGRFDNNEGTITGNIARCPHDRLRFQVFADENVGKHAVTHYKLIEDLGYVSLVECKLETGRTHQIRVHLTHIGHPLFNDERYGGDRILRGTTFTKYKQFIHNCFALVPHHFLHAAVLGFQHPRTKQQMLFEVPMPENMQALIEKWRKYVSNREIEEEDSCI
ncbi:MAG: RluA family pseudouridine synthase [Prevotellaceae bacterium]|jgi:23S rRNA pseudouridine1911/1915/1917 synthase|nr:RluA family pseudouridine synthase [Prevotellaceae bacterium]